MGDGIISGITAIQAILAPALGISATALLMLSISNRFSLTINRIRLLNEERRRYSIKLADKSDLSYAENIRFSNVNNQIIRLLKQCRELRNAVVLMQVAIMLFVLSSLAIGANLFTSTDFLRSLPVYLFSLGMISVLVGIIYSAIDVMHSFKVAKIEIKGDE